jgi:flagellar motor switch protein FliN
VTQNSTLQASMTASAATSRSVPTPPVPAPSPFDEYVALHDVTCDVAVVLGTGRMSVRQCLYLAPQVVVALDQPAGVDLQVMVNGVPVATGEVVIVDDSTAIRLNHVLAPPHAEGHA